MPAIVPARLRQQAVLLAQHFADPSAYVRSLHYLLGYYADRVQRSGQVGAPAPLLPAYRVRPPVLRQILHELVPLAQAEPVLALALCDALWAEGYYEFALLAVRLLGQIPLQPAEAVLARPLRWARAKIDLGLIDALLEDGLRRLRQEQPERLDALVETWLEHQDTFQQQIGLRALRSLANDPAYQNLPALFRLAAPFARSSSPALRPDVLEVIEALARRSPRETAFFLRQHIGLSNAPDIPWLLRQSLHAFPSEMQENLRQAVRPF